ncbi:hypothetical protein C7R94_29250 [Brevibacillus sp. NRRL NRS-603]|nr:hypothetical protein C7R94_29250 [Brevibacillus sp. NRRL NRS-603]
MDGNAELALWLHDSGKAKKAPIDGCFLLCMRGNRCFLIALCKTSKFLARSASTLPFVPRCN